MSAIDHRAEAERILRETGAGSTSASLAEYTAALTRAQVHATLAAGTPVADQHVSEAARDWRKMADKYFALRDADLALLGSSEPVGPGRDAVDTAAVDRIRELLGEVSS